jgi:hypothetical protein
MSTTPPLPRQARAQRFADLILAGASQAEAYRAVGFQAKTPAGIAVCAHKLAIRPDVAAYMEWQRRASATQTTLTLQEKREFLARVVRIPLLKIDTDSATYEHGDLIKKFKTKTDEMGTTVEIEKHDPLKAIEIDNKLSGDDPEAEALADLVTAIQNIANNSPLPTGKL